MAYLLEAMRVEDISQVSEIERESFSMVWSQQAYRRELEHNSLARYIVLRMVPEAAGEACDGDAAPRRTLVLEQASAPSAATEAASGPRRRASTLTRLFAALRSPGERPEQSPEQEPAPIVGYVGLWLMLDEAHITAIAVRRPLRRRGLGELLLTAAIELAIAQRASFVTLEVRSSNLAAQRLYEKYDFRKVGLRPRYYTDNGEDAVLMSSPLLSSAGFQGEFRRLREANLARLDTCVLHRF